MDRLPKDLPKVKFESFVAKPNDAVAKLHNRYTAEMTGAAVRPTYPAAFYIFGQQVEGYLWKDAKGKPVGHVLIHTGHGRVNCVESTGEVDQILSVLAAIAAKKGLKELHFETLPYLSPMARKLRTLTCRCERNYVKSGNAMVRVMNLRNCLAKMTVELEARLRASYLADYRGELVVASPEESVGLKINRGKVAVVEKASSRNAIRGGHEIAQLLIGTDEPMEICEAGKMRLSGDAAQLLPVLFPNEHPQLHQADRY